MEAREHVNVIVCAIDPIEVAFAIFDDTPNVAEKVLATVRP
jgi:hypothetical protein